MSDSDSSSFLGTDDCTSSSDSSSSAAATSVRPPGVTEKAHEYVDTRPPKVEPLKRKVGGAPRGGQRTFTLIDASGEPKLKQNGQVMTFTAKTPQAAAIKAFNHEMRTKDVRDRLQALFAKTDRAKRVYDAAAQPIPQDLTRHLEYLRNTLLPQHVTKGLDIVRAGKTTRGAGSLNVLVKAAKLDAPSMNDTDVLEACRTEFDACAERYKAQFWKALKGFDDDRFYFDPMVPIRMREENDTRTVRTYLCKYVRKTRPPMLSVLRPNFTFEAKAIAVSCEDTSTSGIMGGMFKPKRDSSKIDKEMASVIHRMRNLSKFDTRDAIE